MRFFPPRRDPGQPGVKRPEALRASGTLDVRLAACAVTDPGMRSGLNEDSFLVFQPKAGRWAEAGEALQIAVSEECLLLAVADGVGGNQAGEVASRMAVQALAEEWAAGWRGHDPAAVLRRAVEAANERVWQSWQTNAAWTGMAATLTAALVTGRTAYVVSVGDSRCYLFRGHELRQITKDQSVGELLVESGRITREEALHGPGRGILLQAVGAEKTIDVAEISVDLRRGDWLVLCTDGLYKALSEAEIQAVLTQGRHPRDVCRRLMAGTVGKAHDNVTIVVAEASGAGLRLPADRERMTGSLHLMHDYDPVASGSLTQEDLKRLLNNSRRSRSAQAHKWLLVGYGLMLLAMVGYILFKALALGG